MQLACPHCHKIGNVPDRAQGKRGRCPSCGGHFFVPVQAQPAPNGHVQSAGLLARFGDLTRIEVWKGCIKVFCGKTSRTIPIAQIADVKFSPPGWLLSGSLLIRLANNSPDIEVVCRKGEEAECERVREAIERCMTGQA